MLQRFTLAAGSGAGGGITRSVMSRLPQLKGTAFADPYFSIKER
ncbi:hypothetical protein [Mucilaginibacter sp.]|nr:hypothetical protein [Mucilaginibacter sp.]MDR3697704.1 hypothetical protein [Mucilaginibacter sp.]